MADMGFVIRQWCFHQIGAVSFVWNPEGLGLGWGTKADCEAFAVRLHKTRSRCALLTGWAHVKNTYSALTSHRKVAPCIPTLFLFSFSRNRKRKKKQNLKSIKIIKKKKIRKPTLIVSHFTFLNEKFQEYWCLQILIPCRYTFSLPFAEYFPFLKSTHELPGPLHCPNTSFKQLCQYADLQLRFLLFPKGHKKQLTIRIHPVTSTAYLILT